MAKKWTVRWNQEVVSGDYWRVGEERELTTEQFYFMETVYPGCVVQVEELKTTQPAEPAWPERAVTPPAKRVVTRAPARKPPARPATKRK